MNDHGSKVPQLDALRTEFEEDLARKKPVPAEESRNRAMALQDSELKELKVLDAIEREQRAEKPVYVADLLIAKIARLDIDEVRDCLETLEKKECVQLSCCGTDQWSPHHGQRPPRTQLDSCRFLGFSGGRPPC